MLVDTTMTVLAGNLYRLLARQLPRYEAATPTGSGGTPSTPQEPCTSPTVGSPSTSPCAPTTRFSSTPGSPTRQSPSPGGTAAPYASGSRIAEPQDDSLTEDRG